MAMMDRFPTFSPKKCLKAICCQLGRFEGRLKEWVLQDPVSDKSLGKSKEFVTTISLSVSGKNLRINEGIVNTRSLPMGKAFNR